MIDDNRAAVIDADGATLPLPTDFDPWNLVARCGDNDVVLFGEIGHGHFRPLTVDIGNELVPL